MTLLRCTKFIFLIATLTRADDNSALSSLLASLQNAQASSSSTANNTASSLTASDLINNHSGDTSVDSDSAPAASASNPLSSLLNLGDISSLANLANPSALSSSLGSLTALTNASALTSSLGNLADLTSLTAPLGNLGNLTSLTGDLSNLGSLTNALGGMTDLSALTNSLGGLTGMGNATTLSSGMDVSALTQGLNVSSLLNQAGQLSNTFGELSSLASTANTLLGSVAGNATLAKPMQELLSMAGAVSGIGSSVAGLVNTTNTLTNLSSVMDPDKLLQEVAGSAANPLNILSNGLGATSSINQAATANSVPSSLVKAFITNGYLNQAGQSAMRLSGLATEAYQYQDLANVLSGAAPAVDSSGKLTVAVQRALADMGINATTPEELITHAINRGLNMARRLTAEHPTFKEAILNFNNALGAAVKSQVAATAAEEDKAKARMLQGMMGGYGYMQPPMMGQMQGLPPQAGLMPGLPPQGLGMSGQGMGMYSSMGYAPQMNQGMMPHYGSHLPRDHYMDVGPRPMDRIDRHDFLSYNPETVYDPSIANSARSSQLGTEVRTDYSRSGIVPTEGQARPLLMPPEGDIALSPESQLASGTANVLTGQDTRVGQSNYPTYPTRPEYQLLEKIASRADSATPVPQYPGRRLQSWINDTLGALVAILDEERPEWKSDVQNAANELATQLDSLAESLRSGDLPDKLQSLWQSVSARAAEINAKSKEDAAEHRRLQEIYFQQVGLPFMSSLAPFMSLASPLLGPLQSPLQGSGFQLPSMSSLGGLSGLPGLSGLGGSGLGFRRRLSPQGHILTGASDSAATDSSATSPSTPTQLESLLLSSGVANSDKGSSVQAAAPASDIMSMLNSLSGTTDLTGTLSTLLNNQGSAAQNPLANSLTGSSNPLASLSNLPNPLGSLTSGTASAPQPFGTTSGSTVDLNALLSGLSGGVDTSSLLNSLTGAATSGGLDLSSLLPSTSNNNLVSTLSSSLPSVPNANDVTSTLSNALSNSLSSITQGQLPLNSLLSGQGLDTSALGGNLDVSALTASLNNLLPHQRRLQAAGWPFTQLPAYTYPGLSPQTEYPGLGFYPLNPYWASPYALGPQGMSLGGLLQHSLGQTNPSDTSTPRESGTKELQGELMSGQAVKVADGASGGSVDGDGRHAVTASKMLTQMNRMDPMQRQGFRGDGIYGNDMRRQDMRMDEHRRQDIRNEAIRDEHRRQDLRGEGLRGGERARLDARNDQRRYHDRYLRRLEASDVSAGTINERLRAQSVKTAGQSTGAVPSGNVTDSEAIANAVNVLSQSTMDSESSAGVNLQEFLNVLYNETSTAAEVAAAVTKGLPTGLSLSDLTAISKKLGLDVDPVVSNALDAASLGTMSSNSTTSSLGALSGLLKPLESLSNGGGLNSLISAFGSILSPSSQNTTGSNSQEGKGLTSAGASNATSNSVTGSEASVSGQGTLDLSSLLNTGSSDTAVAAGPLDLSSLLSGAGGTAGVPGVANATTSLDLGSLIGTLGGLSGLHTGSGSMNLTALLGSAGSLPLPTALPNATGSLNLESLMGSLGGLVPSAAGSSDSMGLANMLGSLNNSIVPSLPSTLNLTSLLSLGSPNALASLLNPSALQTGVQTPTNSVSDTSKNLTSSFNTTLLSDVSGSNIPVWQTMDLPSSVRPGISMGSGGVVQPLNESAQSAVWQTMDIPTSLRPSLSLNASHTVKPLNGTVLQGGDASNVHSVASGGLNISSLPSMGTMDFNPLTSFNLSSLANIDWTKLNDLDLSKLGTVDLGQLGTLDLSKLEDIDFSKLASIDFSKLGTIDLSKLDLSALSSLLSPTATSSNTGANTAQTDHTSNATGTTAARVGNLHRMLAQILSEEDRANIVNVLDAPIMRQSMASVIQSDQLSEALKAELSSLLKSQVRSLQAVNTYGLSNSEFKWMQGLLGSDTSTWLSALHRIEARGVDLAQTKVAFDANGTPSVGKEGIDLSALKKQLEADVTKETQSAGVPLAGLATGLANSGVDLNALVHNVTSSSLDINGLLRIMDVTGVDVNNLVRGLESAQAADPAILKEILEGATGHGINYQSLSQAVNLLESINPMLGLSSLANNADIKHAMQVLNLTDISPLIGTNPLALFQPKLPGVTRRLSDVVGEIKARAGAMEAVQSLNPVIAAQSALSHSNQQRMLLDASGLPARNSVVLASFDSQHRKLESMSPPTTIPISTLQANVKAQPVDVRFDQTISFVSANLEGKFIATTGDLGFNWNFDEESSMIPPTIACWSVDGQAESTDSWPSVIVQSAALDIINKETGSVIRTLDLSRPDSENVFEYYSPGWNVTQAWLKKRNDSCAWIPMCYLMDQLAQLKSQGPLSASLSILVDRVPPSRELDMKDAHVVVRSVAAQGVWEPVSAEANLIPIGTVLSPPVAQIGKIFENTPVFGFELPKPSESVAVQGSSVTGYAVLASAESTGLTFVFDEVSWSWIPESAHPAYARILDQLKTFDDKYSNDDDNSDEIGSDDDDDYEASAIAMFNAKRDLPIKVNEWTYIPRFVLETVAYTPERNYIVQKCLPLTGMSSTMDPLASTIFEMLYNNGGALETSILMKTFMEAAPIQAMVSSQEGISIFDMRNTLIDDYSSAAWRVNVSLSKIYPQMRGQGDTGSSSGTPCASGECELWQL